MTRPHHPSSPPRVLVAALGLVAVLASGCNSGVTGDPPSKPPANVCGTGTHISSVLGGFYGPAPWVQPANVNSMGCPYPGDTTKGDTVSTISATCLTVTAVDRWDETGNGAVGTVYVQDTLPSGTAIPKYAAISIFDPSFSPPDLHVLPGDVVDVSGQYEEFVGPSTAIFAQCETLPQIAGAAAFRFDGTVPAPVVITPADLASYESARQYLSMLVTVSNVVIGANVTEKSGRYTADVVVPSGTVWQIDDELFDLPHQLPLATGDSFTSVTGIVTYFYGFHLAPRSVADFAGAVIPDAGAGDGG